MGADLWSIYQQPDKRKDATVQSVRKLVDSKQACRQPCRITCRVLLATCIVGVVVGGGGGSSSDVQLAPVCCRREAKQHAAIGSFWLGV